MAKETIVRFDDVGGDGEYTFFVKNSVEAVQTIGFVIPGCSTQDEVIAFLENNQEDEHYFELRDGQKEEIWEYAGTEWKDVSTILNPISFFIYDRDA